MDQSESLNKNIVNNLINHQAIGFDVDHCLVRYKIKALTELCYTVLTSTLVEKFNYPQRLINISSEQLCFANNYCIIHIENGTVLKLDENLKIMKAYRGFTEINVDEEYGVDRHLPDYNPMGSMRQDPKYVVCGTYFENALPLIFSKLNEYQSQEQNVNKLQPDQYKEIFSQIIVALKSNYQHFDQNKVYPIVEYGNFFKAIHANPQKYMFKQNQFCKILQKLKSQGKFLFIVTNSHFEFMNLTMTFSYGEDWQQLFDIIVVKGGKPIFFTNPKAPMYLLDLNTPLMKGAQIESIIDSQQKIFVEGNYTIIEEYIVNKFKTDVRILFLGDNIMTDCYFPQLLQNWDAIAIVEELYEELEYQNKLRQEAEENIIKYQRYWGDYLYMDVNGNRIRSYWYSIVRQMLKGCIRTLDCPETLSLWD